MINELGLKKGDSINVRFDETPGRGWWYIITKITDDEIIAYDIAYSIDEPYNGGLVITNEDISSGKVKINEGLVV
jgi:hypothetical protein